MLLFFSASFACGLCPPSLMSPFRHHSKIVRSYVRSYECEIKILSFVCACFSALASVPLQCRVSLLFVFFPFKVSRVLALSLSHVCFVSPWRPLCCSPVIFSFLMGMPLVLDLYVLFIILRCSRYCYIICFLRSTSSSCNLWLREAFAARFYPLYSIGCFCVS